MLALPSWYARQHDWTQRLVCSRAVSFVAELRVVCSFACAPGQFSLSASVSCSACPQGRFSRLSGQPSCDPCKISHTLVFRARLTALLRRSWSVRWHNWSARLHRLSCWLACSVLAAVTLSSLAAGRSQSQDGMPSCAKCGLGLSGPSTGMKACSPCGCAPLYSSHVVSLHLLLRSPGTFANSTGFTICLNCAPGGYSTSPNGAPACT